MGTGRAPRRPATYLLVGWAALLTLLSGPSAAAHAEVADLGSAPHIEGMSPHGDDATTRVAFIEGDLDASTSGDLPACRGSEPHLRWPAAAVDALGPRFAVAASPWSGRAPPQASLTSDST